ncbi:hypothetical protein H257_11378 [Aphanomyces astaci]|uniref:Uncharacterized protein n=1 Tax=Aphanomyces astaci TaxID=112090 RepID=W4G301_APHAT|nr:hypothetical protein H257_11378 [Aphanomyces astaci]ETV74067.1 hypothetical protein H257_11378 [Aphanomyces astaci]|eukprot:XP_009836580.1 hypothetical protein H257_11378 [Aphanomyces astaci]
MSASSSVESVPHAEPLPSMDSVLHGKPLSSVGSVPYSQSPLPTILQLKVIVVATTIQLQA